MTMSAACPALGVYGDQLSPTEPLIVQLDTLKLSAILCVIAL